MGHSVKQRPRPQQHPGDSRGVQDKQRKIRLADPYNPQQGTGNQVKPTPNHHNAKKNHPQPG